MWRMHPGLAEFFMAREFGWSLEYIRGLEEKDFQQMTTCLEILYRTKGNEHKAAINKVF